MRQITAFSPNHTNYHLNGQKQLLLNHKIITIEIFETNFRRISTNPFGSDSENDEPDDTDSLSAKRTPVPTPRKPM